MNVLRLLTALGALTFTANIHAADLKAASALAQQKACMACHAVDRKVVGPSFKDVAKKYKAKPDVAALAGKIKKGGVGVWGNIPMPPNNVTEAEAKQLAQWVLAQ